MLPEESILADLDESARERLRALPKMSTTLVEFVAPLMELHGELSDEQWRTLLLVGSFAWNASEGGTPGEEEFESRLDSKLDPMRRHQMRQTMELLAGRRKAVFADDPRSVGPSELVHAEDGGRTILVPVVESARLRAYVAGSALPDRCAGLAPAFADFVRSHRLDHRFVSLAIRGPFAAGEPSEPRRLRILWRGESADWEAPALTSLMRGAAEPPADHGGEAFTRRYLPVLFEIEGAVLRLAAVLPDVPRDKQIRDAYRSVRRWPDGRISGPLDAVVWQAAALALARQAVSAREFDAIFRRLERSVQFHERWPGGSDYIAFLRTAIPLA